MRSVKVLMVMLLWIALGSWAAGEVFYPIDDMYIDTITVGDHQEHELYVANDPAEPHINEILMRFDLSPYMGATIDEAVLWVYRFYGCSGGNTDARIYDIAETWDETTWPNDQYIDHGTVTWSQRILGVVGWNECDITYLVQSWLNGDFPNNGLVMRGYDGTHMSKLYSSEAAPEHRPHLDIVGLTDIETEQPLPKAIAASAYPNPFNSKVVISYSLAGPATVTLEIFNILGQKVATPVRGFYQAGNQQTTWNADGNPSGMYFYKLTINNDVVTDKLLYLK